MPGKPSPAPVRLPQVHEDVGRLRRLRRPLLRLALLASGYLRILQIGKTSIIRVFIQTCTISILVIQF